MKTRRGFLRKTLCTLGGAACLSRRLAAEEAGREKAAKDQPEKEEESEVPPQKSQLPESPALSDLVAQYFGKDGRS